MHGIIVAQVFNRIVDTKALSTRSKVPHGKRIGISIADTGNHWCFLIDEFGLHSVGVNSKLCDVHVRGSLLDFLRLAMRCCFSVVSMWNTKVPQPDFAGLRHRRTTSLHNSSIPLRTVWPGIWNAKACWNEMPSTAIWRWKVQMKTRWISCAGIPLPWLSCLRGHPS